MKAKAALEKGAFKDEIVPVRAIGYKDGQRVYKDFTVDELPRSETTLEGLGKLPPAFAQGGSVTAGNSSPISDGAAAALVMSRAKADELGIKPLGVFQSFVTVGVDPGDHGDRPAARGEEAAGEEQPQDLGHRPVRDERGVREPGGVLPDASSGSPTTGSTSTAARSRSVTRSGARAPSSPRRRSTSCAGAAASTRW